MALETVNIDAKLTNVQENQSKTTKDDVKLPVPSQPKTELAGAQQNGETVTPTHSGVVFFDETIQIVKCV